VKPGLNRVHGNPVSWPSLKLLSALARNRALRADNGDKVEQQLLAARVVQSDCTRAGGC